MFSNKFNTMTAERFEMLYKEHFSRIFNYIYCRIGNPHTAEDLTAETFVRAYEYGGSFNPEKGQAAAWLGKIARNVVNDHFKKVAVRPLMVELSDCLPHDADVEEEFLRREIVCRLLAHIGALPPRQRELLALKYLLCLNNREIAILTGMGESAVGSALFRIIGTLRKKMADEV